VHPGVAGSSLHDLLLRSVVPLRTPLGPSDAATCERARKSPGDDAPGLSRIAGGVADQTGTSPSPSGGPSPSPSGGS
jgi:hypothetical protein